ncbi:hypothetical protein B566_EDAN011058 [Ephemera danica]|nr:hypothetical protein B566_EDAN011058 [Ephemera danica]
MILLVALASVFRFELIYMKQLWRMKRKNEKRPIQKIVQPEFDAFISYCKTDRDWVVNQLLPILEPPVGKYNLCLHERDFRLGNFIMDNIVENIEKSRRVIFVLSNNFLKSEWCKWELRMATHRIFERSNSDFLILLMLENLQRDLVPLSLRVLLTTRTYLEWKQKPEVFWNRLKQILGEPLSNPVINSQNSLEPYKAVEEMLVNLEAVKNDPDMFEKFINDLDTNV